MKADDRERELGFGRH